MSVFDQLQKAPVDLVFTTGLLNCGPKKNGLSPETHDGAVSPNANTAITSSVLHESFVDEQYCSVFFFFHNRER